MTDFLKAIPAAFHQNRHLGIPSVCSAHPMVIEAALRYAIESGQPALIEATCNQVNQEGGYTGMTPMDFRRFVEGIANDVGMDMQNIILGGDHLGPNPWKSLPADQAMKKADEMIAAFSRAGFTKLHLDTSMACAGEADVLTDEDTAERAARLAAVAEAHKSSDEPVYVIGTEVPVPGGATHALDQLEVTDPDAVVRTIDVHRQAFQGLELFDAFDRVIGVVVQPGVEFGHTDVVAFDRTKAQSLSDKLKDYPGLVFEAHSTDYQSLDALEALVSMGFSILKVGPWLTFAMREALYKLDAIADIMENSAPAGRLMSVMESTMLAAPDNWKKYYAGDEHEQWLQRHFSLSDRIRYYWPTPIASRAVNDLLGRLAERSIPTTLVHQYFPDHKLSSTPITARELLLDAITQVLRLYHSASSPPR